MKSLPATIVALKNSLAVSGAWLTLMSLRYPDTVSPTVSFDYVNDNSLIIVDSDLLQNYTWEAGNFQIQQLTEELKMELPRVSLTIYDPLLALKQSLQANEGLSGGIITLRRVYRATNGTVTDTNISQQFTILDVAMSDTTVTFTIGIADPLSRRFPRDNYSALMCRHRFKQGFCRYAGADTTCTHTLEDSAVTNGCRTHNNSHMFGGSPGSANGIFYDIRE